MKHKYISQDNKSNVWKISNTKSGKSIKNFNSKQRAITHLGKMSDVFTYEIKINEIWEKHVLDKNNQEKVIDLTLKKSTISTSKKSPTKKLVSKKKLVTQKKEVVKKTISTVSTSKKSPTKKLVSKKKLVSQKKEVVEKTPLATEKSQIKQSLIQSSPKKQVLKKTIVEDDQSTILLTKQKNYEIKKNVKKSIDLKANLAKSHKSKKNLSFLLPVVGLVILGILIILMNLWYTINW